MGRRRRQRPCYAGSSLSLRTVVGGAIAILLAIGASFRALRTRLGVAYYFYENYPTNHVTIHVGSCGLCNDGRGRKGQPVTENGRWHGPFSTKGAAEEAAKLTRRPCDDHGCVP